MRTRVCRAVAEGAVAVIARTAFSSQPSIGEAASAITYWASGSDGWHVVTTVDTLIEQNGDVEKHAVVRFSSVLLPGQSQLISVPFAIGERQPVLRIRRLGDRIEVAQVGGSA